MTTNSKLTKHGLSFHNWPGAGEAAAEHFGLSHTVVIPADAKLGVVGGQLGLNDDDTVPDNLTDELLLAFEHVKQSLVAAGHGDDAFEYIYEVTLYFVNSEKVFSGLEGSLSAATSKYLKSTRPAMTGVFVAALFHPAASVEVTVKAVFPSKA